MHATVVRVTLTVKTSRNMGIQILTSFLSVHKIKTFISNLEALTLKILKQDITFFLELSKYSIEQNSIFIQKRKKKCTLLLNYF